jgi:class 3 adenylate cyclase
MPVRSTTRLGIHNDERDLDVTSHLATVLAADIAGYSRMMELDPRYSILRLQTLRRELIEPVSDDFGATLVRYAGDSIIAEFQCPTVAVNCAIIIQRALLGAETHIPEERQIRLRIGISSGQVFNVDGDLHGTTVNVAARLQALAVPGDIYLSGATFNQAGDKLLSRCEFLGSRQLKNILTPVHVFRVLLEEMV